MNIFNKDTAFVELDNRRNRAVQQCSAESLHNKFSVELPENLIRNKTVLDLGSCLGAAGHWALTYNAQSYTGVEIQDYYVNTSNQLLSTHWSADQFKIVKQDIDQFLDQAILAGDCYDYVVAAGVIYGFLDVISLLKKISLITKEYVVFDTFNTTTAAPNHGSIIIKKNRMIRAVDADTDELFEGYGSMVSVEALDIIMSTNSFYRQEPVLIPLRVSGSGVDPYNDNLKLPNGERKPSRYIARYNKQSTAVKTINQLVINDDTSSVKKFGQIAKELQARKEQ